MNEPITQAEASSVAMDLANKFRQLLRSYQSSFGLTPEQAAVKAREAPGDYPARILARPPDQIDWLDLHFLAENHPEQFFPVWQAIKSAALDELRCGDRAA